MCDVMKTKLFLVFVATAWGLSGCSYIQNYFPDKERDYQYTTEIPLINYPAELRSNPVESGAYEGEITGMPHDSTNSESGEYSLGTGTGQPAEEPNSQENPPEPQPVPDPKASSTEVVPADESDQRDTVSSVEVVRYDDGESRLRLGSGFSKAWRVVNKALSRNTIEVTGRNHDKAQITVQYDPDEKKAKDDSYLDEIAFMFKGININDREYVLKLEEHDLKTDVLVLNEEHLPLLNDDAALDLLKVLADTIKADLADKAK
jgi:outer membrane protein assembly factor BamC